MEEQGQLPVGHGVLGEVVVDDQAVLPGVEEILAHGGPGKGGDILHGGGAGDGQPPHGASFPAFGAAFSGAALTCQRPP